LNKKLINKVIKEVQKIEYRDRERVVEVPKIEYREKVIEVEDLERIEKLESEIRHYR